MHFKLLVLIFLAILITGCAPDAHEAGPKILFGHGAYPHAVESNGKYYYIMQAEHGDSLNIYVSDDLAEIQHGSRKTILTSVESGMHNFYSPELHYINDRWCLYFEADDGRNTDNHQLYVLENPSANPLTGKWTLHGPILTNPEWNFGIHPSTFVIDRKQYLVWSGWPKRRIENETQCIFIAEMENPWTLRSERIVISSPEYEWERQWINPDGTRTPYPIFVNENPEPIISPDGKNVVIAYSASGIWTVYNNLGVLYASADSDLLDPSSWKKLPEPQFITDDTSRIYGTSNISVLKNGDKEGEYFMLYQAKSKDSSGIENYDIRLKQMHWNEKGLPEFGKP